MAKLTEPRWTHVALPVSDLDRSIEFYTGGRVPGAGPREQGRQRPRRVAVQPGPDRGPVRAGARRVHPRGRQAVRRLPGEKVPILTPFAHIGIELPNREDVDAAAARAKAVGGLRLGPVDMAAHIGYVCFVDDPDGNTIEFSHKQQVFETIQELWDGKETVQL